MAELLCIKIETKHGGRRKKERKKAQQGGCCKEPRGKREAEDFLRMSVSNIQHGTAGRF